MQILKLRGHDPNKFDSISMLKCKKFQTLCVLTFYNGIMWKKILKKKDGL